MTKSHRHMRKKELPTRYNNNTPFVMSLALSIQVTRQMFSRALLETLPIAGIFKTRYYT